MRPLAGVLRGCLFALSFARPSAAHAQEVEIDENLVPPLAPDLSPDLVDPVGHSRFHLVTRASFSDGRDVFSSNTVWSFEARAHVRLAEGLALTAVLPFGLLTPTALPNQFFFGNLSVGVAGGGRFRLSSRPTGVSAGPSIRLGGALDVYVPTAPEPASQDLTLGVAETAVARLRSYEPQLYVSNTMAFRGRAHADLSTGPVTAGVELGLAPAFTLSASSEFLLWFSVAGRLSAQIVPEIEPFLEMGSAIQVTGPGDLSPPFLVTPGVRFHFSSAHLDPAVFVSLNFEDTSRVIFGVDIAGALRPSRRGDAESLDDFFGGL